MNEPKPNPEQRAAADREARRAARAADKTRGRWVYPTVKLEVDGVHYEVQANGDVYQRQFLRLRPARVRRGQRQGEKLEPSGLVAGPLVKVKDYERAAGIRDEARRRIERARSEMAWQELPLRKEDFDAS